MVAALKMPAFVNNKPVQAASRKLSNDLCVKGPLGGKNTTFHFILPSSIEISIQLCMGG